MAVDLQRAAVRLQDCFSGLVDRRKDRVIHFLDSEEYKQAWRTTQCSNSHPLTPTNWPKVAHSHQTLKEHARNGVGPAVRKQLWIGVAEVIDDDSVLFAKAFGEPVDDDPEQVQMMYGFPYDLDCLPLYCMKPVFDAAFDRVLTAIAYTHPHITVCPLLPVLVRVMLHFLDEWECYAVLYHLLMKHARNRVDQDLRELLASQTTFRSLCHSHARSSLPDLMRLKPGSMADESFLAQLTRHWYTWPFYKQPFWITVRVLDLYMVEGPKILYRLGLSAIKLFASHMQPVALAGVDVEEAVQQFTCGMSAQQRSQWFNGAFSISRLPWNTIVRQWTAYLSKIPEGQVDLVDGPLLPVYKRSVEPDFSSEILSTEEHWQLVWEWLPDWVTAEHTECVFRASRDGYNLRTLYRKCEDLMALVLLVKTTRGEVFGAFIASDLNERHGAQFFGTGETFLFSLFPTVHCYHWSGENDLILRGNDCELAVGSGGGAYGLWLDGELDKGVTSTCLAFRNSPLTGADSQFSCTAIEVYSCA